MKKWEKRCRIFIEDSGCFGGTRKKEDPLGIKERVMSRRGRTGYGRVVRRISDVAHKVGSPRSGQNNGSGQNNDPPRNRENNGPNSTPPPALR